MLRFFARNLTTQRPPAQSLGIPPERCLLLYVGRLAQEKNTQTLFAAFELLTERDPQRYHLLVVGDGLQRAELRRLQERTGSVTWRQYCTDSEELARLYRAADLFVHPGVQETFGLTALESQACGTPVVGIRGSYMDRIIFGSQEHWARENSVPGPGGCGGSGRSDKLATIGPGGCGERAGALCLAGGLCRNSFASTTKSAPATMPDEDAMRGLTRCSCLARKAIGD